MCILSKSIKIAAAAKYLIKVGQDDKLFASYFWWRKYYTAIKEDWAEVSCLTKGSLKNRLEKLECVKATLLIFACICLSYWALGIIMLQPSAIAFRLPKIILIQRI